MGARLGVFRGVDLVAAAGAVAAMGSLCLYLAIMASDSSGPATWVLVVLVAGGLLCLSASPVRMPGRAAPLLVASLLLGALGALAIFSIGVVVLVAAAFAFWAFLIAVFENPA